MKTLVFLSRPNVVPAPFEKGLERFLRFLDGHKLDAKTIGSTDIPIAPPFQEVVTQLQACSGVIVLGIPQIEVTTGILKRTPLTAPLTLASEWNHIEATLALMLHKPTLVIHHPTVSRGIFDRGAFPVFIHSTDMTSPGWAWEPNVAGAFETWKQRLVATQLIQAAVASPGIATAPQPLAPASGP
jgi:hypothetical protein